MPCLSCAQSKNVAYDRMIVRKLDIIFEKPCADCGETDKDILDFASGNKVWDMVASQSPWPEINKEIQKTEVVCGNCLRRRISATVGRYGIPSHSR